MLLVTSSPIPGNRFPQELSMIRMSLSAIALIIALTFPTFSWSQAHAATPQVELDFCAGLRKHLGDYNGPLCKVAPAAKPKKVELDFCTGLRKHLGDYNGPLCQSKPQIASS